MELAAIEIPKFTGVYTVWAAFYDIYMALIHANKYMCNIQKFFIYDRVLVGMRKK